MTTLIALLLATQDLSSAKPGKDHEHLKAYEGEWDYVSKFMIAPGQPPTVSKGRETGRLIAGGLFVVTDAEGEMMGAKFIGHGVMGYDPLKKKYTGSWVDSMSPGQYVVEGTLDETGKILTEVMQGVDPGSGEPLILKLVHEIKDKDHRVLKIFFKGPDGKDVETGSLEYTRRK